MAYTTLNKMVTVFINNICSFINNFTLRCRIPKFCYHAKMIVTCSYDDEKSVWYKILGHIFTQPSYCQFAVQKSHLVTIAIGGSVGSKFQWHRYIVQYCTKPRFGAIFMILSLILANFVLKFPHFRLHGNEGRPGVNFCGIVKLPDLNNPLLVQHSWPYALY